MRGDDGATPQDIEHDLYDKRHRRPPEDPDPSDSGGGKGRRSRRQIPNQQVGKASTQIGTPRLKGQSQCVRGCRKQAGKMCPLARQPASAGDTPSIAKQPA